ncbi:hypothetical protein [Dyadobacter sp. CY347]|uniref:hypothetical protein n=1 Tax=Dyadobacter sp. CY347 TaxID=2909336 RepID=UPI001F2CA3F0|nr:hypothetical protein [Dyadobacter sp. CY347]MCF2491236.1 hypothetical protein [Dyadobacter sp. CY347]
METITHTGVSPDAKWIAYGKAVNDLLSSSTAESWNRELWTMFSGFMLAQNEMGRSENLSNTYFSFKELLEFFERVERIRKGK